MRTSPSIVIALTLLLAGAAVGCAPKIGDGCANSTNCSINGDRVCDTSQPGGSCTVFDCQADRCPDDAVCVRFNPVPARRAVAACMRVCGNDSDCRTGDGYTCVTATELSAMDPESLTAEVVDRARGDRAFCVATE